MVQRLVHPAEYDGAGDHHLQMDGNGAGVSFQLYGVTSPGARLLADIAGRVLDWIQFLTRLKTDLQSLPHDAQIDNKTVYSASDNRVATSPTVVGTASADTCFEPS